MMAWRDLEAKGGNRQSGDIAKGRSKEGQKQADQARQTRSGAG